MTEITESRFLESARIDPRRNPRLSLLSAFCGDFVIRTSRDIAASFANCLNDVRRRLASVPEQSTRVTIVCVVRHGYATTRASLESLYADYAKFRSRSHHAVIRVYHESGNVIERHDHGGDFTEW